MFHHLVMRGGFYIQCAVEVLDKIAKPLIYLSLARNGSGLRRTFMSIEVMTIEDKSGEYAIVRYFLGTGEFLLEIHRGLGCSTVSSIAKEGFGGFLKAVDYFVNEGNGFANPETQRKKIRKGLRLLRSAMRLLRPGVPHH